MIFVNSFYIVFLVVLYLYIEKGDHAWGSLSWPLYWLKGHNYSSLHGDIYTLK